MLRNLCNLYNLHECNSYLNNYLIYIAQGEFVRVSYEYKYIIMKLNASLVNVDQLKLNNLKNVIEFFGKNPKIAPFCILILECLLINLFCLSL